MSLYPPLVIGAPGDVQPNGVGVGASGFYRVLWPLSMAENMGLIQVRMPNLGYLYQDETLKMMKPDSLMFHRCHTKPQIRYIENCRSKLDAKLVYTIDDWVEKVPKYSEHYELISKDKELAHSVRNAIKFCHRLIVTNQLLANVYGGGKTETYIVPNYLPEMIWKQAYAIPRRMRKTTKPRIGWSGALGHKDDVAILKEIAELLGDSVQWVFLGRNPPDGFNVANSEIYSACPTHEYPKKLYELDLDLALAPLVDNNFNRAKSSLRVLEYGACGYPVIASRVMCYLEDSDFPITLLPYNAKEWVDVIRNKIEHLDKLKEEGILLQKYVWDNYKLEDNIDEYTTILSPDETPFSLRKTVKSDEVDVIITTHNHLDVIQKCVESVIKSIPENKTHINIKIYDDSTESKVIDYLKRLSADVQVTFVPGDSGYIVKINKGIIDSINDVISLNSDVVVPTSNWVDRLREVADSNSKIATVTPLTNNGTLCSYPDPKGSELKPRLVNFYDSVAKSLKVPPVILPTSIGFCSYIKREAIDHIGLFDSHAFGYAYGEENDWCMRSHKYKWFQVAAPNVYVGHEGSAILSSRKDILLQSANKTLSARWPNYFNIIEQYTNTNLIRNAKSALDIACIKHSELENAQGGRTLFFAHALGGGLETHLQGLLQREPGALVLRVDSHQSSLVEISVADETYYNLPKLDIRLIQPKTIQNLFKDLHVKRLYVETTFGYDYNIPIFISNLANALQIPYDIMLHDYYTFCPRLRMINDVMEFCGAPLFVETCEQCIKDNGSPIGQVNVDDWRAMYGNFLRHANKIYAPSNYVKDVVFRHFGRFENISDNPNSSLNIEFVPHESLDEFKYISAPPKYISDTLRVAVIGFLTVDKGSLLVKKCAAYAAANNLPIEFVVIGELLEASGTKMQSSPHLRITGAYEEAHVGDAIRKSGCHLSFFPNLWPEAYSYTLSHAFRFGLYPVAISLGAIAERITERNFGMLIPFDSRHDIKYLIDTLWMCRNWQDRVEKAA